MVRKAVLMERNCLMVMVFTRWNPKNGWRWCHVVLADIGDFSGEMIVISTSFCRPTHSDLDGGLIDCQIIRRRNAKCYEKLLSLSLQRKDFQ